ncbi:MAG: peptidoglycan-binding domain-containing protein [Lamprobacter sp.]|uniref:peptidoglycan-binding domain-containing protein n=1 Tax=Lamprobacter sp. TaxID=3100796 RepID=UPI002B264194|nr:peptidoglycan-binding domain-containing protein [Lamprobacter sp.]MEA3641761.1 peptidoglycan-binding domain-containing protein [Lamprobacter sp.]
MRLTTAFFVLIAFSATQTAFADTEPAPSDANAALIERIEALEERVAALEEEPAPSAVGQDASTDSAPEEPAEEQVSADDSRLVDLYLVRKEAYDEGQRTPNPGVVFDVRFVGTQALGERTIKDIKGAIWFHDAFDDKIVGATTTKRLNIRAGESKIIEGLVIDWLTVGTNADWERVLTTDIDELQVSFEPAKVIFDNSVKLSKEQTRAVQRLLKAQGFDLGTPDGAWGPASRSAMQEFQIQEGIEPTGQLNRASLDALGFDD